MIISRMITKSEKGIQETVQIEREYFDQLKSEIDTLKARVEQYRTETKLAEVEVRSVKRELEEYQNNWLCKVVMKIKHWCHDMRLRWHDRTPIKHKFELMMGDEK